MTTPMKSEVEIERLRLRALGHTDAEISQILIAREVAKSAPQAGGNAPVQGNMTGVLGNASAVLSHVRGTIPIIKTDAANLVDVYASRTSRTRSAAVLTGVAIIVAVLGYVIYQEYQRHVVYDVEIAKEQAAAARAKSCADRLTSLLGVGTLGQVRDPDHHRTLAYKQWAIDCSEFVEPITVSPDALSSENKGELATASPTREDVLAARAELKKECEFDEHEPAASERSKRCSAAVQREQDIFHRYRTSTARP